MLTAFMFQVAFQVGATALQANARTFHAFSRDNGLPDRGLFHRLAPNKVPVYAVWLVVAISIVMCLLELASAVAVNVCAYSLDLRVIIC